MPFVPRVVPPPVDDPQFLLLMDERVSDTYFPFALEKARLVEERLKSFAEDGLTIDHVTLLGQGRLTHVHVNYAWDGRAMQRTYPLDEFLHLLDLPFYDRATARHSPERS